MEIKKIGTLKFWHRDKAFGILRAPNDLNVWVDYFVHVSNISSGDPVVGCRAEFIVGGPTMRGKITRPLLPALEVKFSPQITPAVIATLSTAAVQS
jgi:cold shock CspA family protein